MQWGNDNEGLRMSISVAAASTAGASAQLVKLGNGEYTAASVTNDQKDATKLNLVKENDGNYGTTAPAPTDSSPPVQSSSAVVASLSSLKLGGD